MVDPIVVAAGIAIFLAATAALSYQNGFEWNRRTVGTFLGGTTAAFFVIFALESNGSEVTVLLLLGVTVVAVVAQVIGGRSRSKPDS